MKGRIAMQPTLKPKHRIRKTTFAGASLSFMLLALVCPSLRWRASAQGPFGGPPQIIAFQSNRDGNNEIYLMNPDGTDQTRLTFDAGNDQRPDISPNGEQVVFA